MATGNLTALKTCRKCGETKPITDFWSDSKTQDGLKRQCWVCLSVAQRARRAKLNPKLEIDRVHGNPTTWLRPHDTLMTGGYDFAWCYVLFKEVPGFLGYIAGSDGSLWSCHDFKGGMRAEWRKQRPYKDKHGYPITSLVREGKSITKWVHHIILETFIGPCPEGMEARHFPDPDTTNNRHDNLSWGTHQANMDDRTIHGSVACGERHGMSCLASDDVRQIIEMRKSGMSFSTIGAHFGITRSHAWRLYKGICWKHLSASQEDRHVTDDVD